MKNIYLLTALIFLIFQSVLKPIYAQHPIYETQCHDGSEESSPNTNHAPCNNGFSSFLSNHNEDMIPQGVLRKIKLLTTIIFVQNSNGEGNFSVSNQEHIDYWNAVFDEINNRLESLFQQTCEVSSNSGLCSTSPKHYTNIHLEIVPTFIEIQDDYYWDHHNDPNASTYNSFNKSYLNDILQIAKQNPNYKEGFNVILTEDAADYNTWINNPSNPLWNYYTAHYGPYWYSAFPTNDLSHDAIWHCPDEYLKTINCIEHCGGNWWLYNERLDFVAGGFIHEYGHYFGLSHSPSNDCLDNIMKQSGGGDRNSLTGCQVREIYETLMTKNLRKYVICEDVIDYNMDIVNYETWSNNIKIYNDITIKNGGKLTVTCELHMQPETKIVVERGGELVVNNGILTSCEGKWKGIQVEGVTNGSQSLAGKVVLENGAILENAKDAVFMANFDHQWPAFQDYHGGVIIAHDAIFRDCDRAVAFMKYATFPQDDQSEFIGCSFENLSEGVTIWQNDGVIFDDCTFDDISNRAIHPYDSKILVKNGCTFDDMDIGVDILNTLSNPASSQIGTESSAVNRFTTQEFGVFISSAADAKPLEIKNNNFFGGDYGVYTEGKSHFEVWSNDFVDQNEVGVQFYDTDDQDYNSVVANNISLSKYATSSNKVNFVEFLSNCFDSNTESAIDVSDGSIFPSQGDDQFSANNCFENQTLKITTSNSNSFVYHTKNNTPTTSCKYIDCNTSGDYAVRCDATQDPISFCGSISSPGTFSYPYKDCQIPISLGDKLNMIQNLQHLLSQVTNDPHLPSPYKEYLIAKYKRCLNKVLKEALTNGYYQNNDLEAALTFADNHNSYELKMIAYSLIVRSGNYARARIYLNAMSLSSQDKLDYNTIQNIKQDYNTIQNINLDYLSDYLNYQLSVADKNKLYNIGIKAHSYSGYARSLYYVLTGNRVPVNLTKSNGQSTPRSKSKLNTFDAMSQLSVYPNPVRGGEVTVDLSKHTENIFSVHLVDLQGRVLINKVDVANEKINLNVANLKEGIYFISYFLNGDMQGVEKISVLK